MVTTSTMKKSATSRRLLPVAAAALALLAVTEQASAQEIPLTGPLAGAPAVRKMRLYREGRLELTPAVSFTLLDEYQRTIMAGATLSYNFTDWLGFGVWGSFGVIKTPTDLSEQIQKTNSTRKSEAATAKGAPAGTPGANEAIIADRLTSVNLGSDFRKQLATIDWVAAPELTVTPFRGKLALFQSVYVDTDVHFFAGPAFVGLTERKDCPANSCNAGTAGAFTMVKRTTIAPMFGLGLSFFTNDWGALTVDWRALPFNWNAAGFDSRGKGPNQDFPDGRISSEDRLFKFNQMLSVGYTLFLPTHPRISP